jgi:signal transduction histidine kinase/CheY-like chemotaxis protein
VVNALPGTLMAVDKSFNIILAKDDDFRLRRAGLTADDVLGGKCYKTFMRRERPCPWCRVHEVIESGAPVEEVTNPDDPREKWSGKALQIWVHPVVDESGLAHGAVEYGYDITGLRDAKEKAEAANTAKGEFLANMSHEIRTPLNGVLGMLQLATMTSLNKEQSEYIDIAIKSGRSLLTVINDVLDFSKIEAGKIEMGREAFNLPDMIHTLIEVFRNQADRKRVNLRHDLGDNLPRTVIGDEGRLRQILFNLVGNALKFTDHGEISLKVRVLNETDDAARLKFTVSDTGIGIPDDKVDTIFESFTQVDGSFSRKHSGAGLGLSIVKRLVELMNGEIELRSEIGKGTEVGFDILLGLDRRLDERRDEAAGTTDGQKNAGRRILLVEDDGVNRLTMELYLKKQGYETDSAADGREALDKLRQKAYDAVLMDIQMPEMDGLEAAGRIRDGLGGATPREVPVIAFTAHAMSGDRERFLAAGMNAYVSKPVDFDALLEELARVMGN